MWIVFKRSNKDWARYIPAYFLEIDPKSYRYGLGFYDAPPDLMTRFRLRIDEDPESFLKAVGWFAKQKVFTLEGERYKRPHRPGQARTRPHLVRLQEFLPDARPPYRPRDPLAEVRRPAHEAFRPGRPALPEI